MFDSIRTRLTLWYVGILAAFILVFAVVVYYSVIESYDRGLDVRLQEIAASFKTATLSEEREHDEEGPGNHAQAAAIETSQEMRLKDFPFAVYASNGEVITT